MPVFIALTGGGHCMLELEALAAEARQRGMPAGKMRGILREYLQILILKEMYKLPEGKKLCFTGGTYLRLIHQTKRFSEDLDFNAGRMKEGVFEETLQKVRDNLKREGLMAGLGFGHWGNLLVAELVFPDVEKHYGVVSPYRRKEGILIKIEVNRPRWKIKSETLVTAGFGYLFPVVCTEPGALFADKIDALIKKNRARHLFDILFMLSKKYPIAANVLKSLGIKKPTLDAILERTASFSAAELKKQAEQLRPFLFEESEAALIANAHTIIPQLVEEYRAQIGLNPK